jgi:cytochrome P450
MAWGFYFLAKDPMLRAKLREELEPIMRGAQGGDPPYSELAHASLLNAVINETMRVKTSVPNGGPRITPPEGLQVGDTWIPGEVTIFTPHHIIQHSKLRRPSSFNVQSLGILANSTQQTRNIFKSQTNSFLNGGQLDQR